MVKSYFIRLDVPSELVTPHNAPLCFAVSDTWEVTFSYEYFFSSGDAKCQ
jgi:hypothetical protein